ncbi:MAG: radical SAM family heme chaperone HemW [Deltaproteobacteria bacterium]
MAFGVYVHIPYCVKKCPYCDFNSYGVGSRIPEDDYTLALLAEIDLYRESIEGVPLNSIFFGGGTPSLFSPQNIEKVINKIIGFSSPLPSIEISLEVNPKTADLEKLRGFKAAGVNRISTGIQSFSERKLKLLGRINAPEDSARVLRDIPKAGFDNFNLDLMYGVSFETLEEWQRDLTIALDFGSTHISAYCLTIEDDTEFSALYGDGKLPLPGEDALIEMLECTSDFIEAAGYRRYEISNFARSGRECRHNLLYWRGDRYLGLGAGAHSHQGAGRESQWGARWANVRNPAVYMKQAIGGKKPVASAERLSRKEAVEDKILMGLRLAEGLNLAGLKEEFRARVDGGKLSPLVRDGMIHLEGGALQIGQNGFAVSDEIILRVVDSVVFE